MVHAEFTGLTIKDVKSKNAVSITPDGIWVMAGGSVAASIQIDNGRPLLTVFDHRKDGQRGHQLALSVNADGEPVVQVSHGNKTVIVSGDHLILAAEAYMNKEQDNGSKPNG